MAGLLRNIVSAWRSEGHPTPDVSALLEPLTLVDAQWVWSEGLQSLEDALATEGSRLTRRDTRLPAAGSDTARLHPYSGPRDVPDLPPSIPSTPITLRTSRLATTVDENTVTAYLRLIRLYGDKTYSAAVVPPSAAGSSGPKPKALPAGPDRVLRPGRPGPR
jgi:hypothetical protein